LHVNGFTAALAAGGLLALTVSACGTGGSGTVGKKLQQSASGAVSQASSTVSQASSTVSQAAGSVSPTGSVSRTATAATATSAASAPGSATATKTETGSAPPAATVTKTQTQTQTQTQTRTATVESSTTVTTSETTTAAAPLPPASVTHQTTSVQVAPTSTTANEQTGGFPWWGWVLIGLGAAGLAIGLFLAGRGHGRRSGARQTADGSAGPDGPDEPAGRPPLSSDPGGDRGQGVPHP
jgi:hypothetical protein